VWLRIHARLQCTWRLQIAKGVDVCRGHVKDQRQQARLIRKAEYRLPCVQQVLDKV